MSETRPQVDLFYSYRSPYSYLSIGRLANWVEADGIDLTLRPVLPFTIRQPNFFLRWGTSCRLMWKTARPESPSSSASPSNSPPRTQ